MNFKRLRELEKPRQKNNLYSKLGREGENMNNYEEEYDVPEEYYGTLNEAQLPRIVREFQKSASEVSQQNDTSRSFFYYFRTTNERFCANT